MISTVSIVGADDSVSPESLADISQKYPFVEWSVNLHSGAAPRAGFPSEQWLDELTSISDLLRLQGVLHGRWHRDILDGNLSLMGEKPGLWDALHRLQVDVSCGHRNLIDSIQLIPEKQIVLRAESPNSIVRGLDGSPLLPIQHLGNVAEYCGYVLSKDNLDVALNTKGHFWISLDGFRSDGITLDLLEVERALDKIEDHITNDSWIQGLLSTEAAQRRFSEVP